MFTYRPSHMSTVALLLKCKCVHCNEFFRLPKKFCWNSFYFCTLLLKMWLGCCVFRTDMFSLFLLRLFHLLDQIHSLKMILPHPLLPLFHPPNPLHQTLLAFYGLHSLVSESEWSSSSLLSSEQSFLFTHLPLSQLHTHTFLFVLYLLSVFLYLHHHLPFFCSSSLHFLQFHIAQSTSSPFPLSLSVPLMLESSSGATGRPSLCGFNGFMKYTVSMSDSRNSKL